MRLLFARWRLAATSLAAATAAAAGLTLSGPAQQALAATITQTGPFPVGNLLNYANSDLESTGFNWAPDQSQANDISSFGQDTVSLTHSHSLKIVAASTGTIIYKLGNGQDNTSVAINLPKTGGDYRVGAYMKVPAGTSQHSVEFDLGCYDSTGQWLGWVTGTPVTMNTAGSWQYVEDDFLATNPPPGALPSTCAQVQGSPRVKVTGMNQGGIVHMDEVIFAPYRAAVAIGAHGPKQCDGPTCPYSSNDWWTANQDIAPLPNKALQTDKEFTADLPSTGTDPFSATNCAGDETQVTNHGLNLTKWPVCIIAYQTPVTSTNGVTSQAMDNFLASVPPQQEIILVWHQEPEGDSTFNNPQPGCGTQTGAMAFVCETKLQATFVHNSSYDTPNVFIAQDSAVSWYLNNTSCSWIAPSSATGAGVDLYLVDHYEYDTVTGQNVNTETGNSGHDYTKWRHWLNCASAQNRPLGFGEYGLDNSPDPNGPQAPQFQNGCKATSQNRQNLPNALEADRTYLANLPMSGDPNLVNPAPFVVWDYWDSFWGGTPDCTKLDNTAAINKWLSIETQNGGGG
jgi:hypothetical protein